MRAEPSFTTPGGLRFSTPEPLGAEGDSYPAMLRKPDQAMLDKLVVVPMDQSRKQPQWLASAGAAADPSYFTPGRLRG